MDDARYGPNSISQSLIESYLKCGLRAKFQFIEQKRIINTRMATGTGVSRAAEADNRHKIDTGSGLRLPDLQEKAVTAYENEIVLSEVNETKHEIAVGKDRTAKASVAYGQYVSPAINGVRDTEGSITIDIDGIIYAGTPDYITLDGVGDLKTGKPWRQDRADASRQLTAYGLLHRARYGEFPTRVWIDSVFENRGRWEAQRLWSSRTKTDYQGFVHILKAAFSAMQGGVFLPAPEAAWWCTPKWCPYYKMCPAKGH